MAKARDPRADAAALAARAEAAASSQDMLEAVRLMDESLALEPRDAERRLRAAFFKTCVREYDHAREDLEAAAKVLGPADARPARGLAHLEYVQGRYEPALAASEGIAKPFFQDEFLRGVLAARLGRADEASACLESLRRSGSGWQDLLAAFRAALSDDWEAAAAAAERAAQAERPLEQPQRVELARTAFALKAWQERNTPPAPKAKDSKTAELRLISLGVDPPRFVTLDALTALRDCDVLFVNLASDTTMDLLSCFCRGEIKPINFVDEETRETCARQILAEAKPGRVVGYATYGHVMMLGPLTMLLVRLARGKKLALKCHAGVSAISRLLADANLVLGDGFGSFQLYDARDLAYKGGVPLNPRAALAVYLTDYAGNDRDGFYGQIQQTLCAAYGAAHQAQLWGPAGLQESLALGDVLKASPRLGGRQQLFVPALPRGSEAAPRSRRYRARP